MEEVETIFLDLAQLQEDLIRDLRIPPAREWIHLYLFRNERSYRAFLKARFPQAPYRRALYLKLDGPGTVLAYRSSQFEIDVRHECTHALLHAVLPMVPLWLDEGLAEYYEVPRSDRAGGNPHLTAVRWAVRLGIYPNLESLESRKDLSEMGRADYRAAWAWTHYMIHGPEDAHEELVAFLADILLGAPPGQLSQRIRRKMPNLTESLASHFKSWNPSSLAERAGRAFH